MDEWRTGTRSEGQCKSACNTDIYLGEPYLVLLLGGIKDSDCVAICDANNLACDCVRVEGCGECLEDDCQESLLHQLPPCGK